MNTLIEKLQISLADAETTLENADVHDDIEYGKAEGKVEGLKEALGIVEGYANEQGGFWG